MGNVKSCVGNCTGYMKDHDETRGNTDDKDASCAISGPAGMLPRKKRPKKNDEESSASSESEDRDNRRYESEEEEPYDG